ncbi:MAG: hypothetical protein EB107_09490, partial [Proteobacteria bacterium]|nr:hypothetical protein [Pseudomonadota bacterium]
GRTFLTLSLPAVIDQLSFSGMFLILGRILLSMGPSVFAAQRIAITAGSVSWLPAIGLQIAATALVGQAIGAKDYDRVAAVNRFAQQLAIGWMIAAAVIFVVGAQQIAGFFTADPDIMAQAAWALYSFAPGLPNWFRHSGPARRVRLPGGPKDHCSHANHAILDDSHARPRDSSGRNTVGWQPGHHRSAPRARCHD